MYKTETDNILKDGQLKAVRLFWTRVGESPGTGVWIGSACLREGQGWWFNPRVSGHRPSRRHWPTWEECLPRWTGGLDSTTSYGVYSK